MQIKKWPLFNKNAKFDFFPGMQTIFDAMIKDLILIGIITFAFSTIIHINFGSTAWNQNLAITALVLHFISAFAMFVQVFNTVLVRYLSIFHSPLLHEWNEDSVILTSRGFAAFLSCLAVTYEAVFNGYGQGPMFDHMTKQVTSSGKKPAHFLTMEILVITVFIWVIYVFLKIEKYKAMASLNDLDTESQSHTNNLVAEVLDNIGTIRALTFLIGSVCGLTLIWLLTLTFVTDHALHSSRVQVISSILLYNVVPITVIKRTPSIQDYFKHHIEKMFICCNCCLPKYS